MNKPSQLSKPSKSNQLSKPGKPENNELSGKAQQLTRFYQDYIQAFAIANVSAVADCYQLPCVLSTPEKLLLLDSEESFREEFNGIFAMLSEHNITGFKASNASYQHINNALTLVKIDWRFYDQDNQLFSEFTAIYHLSYRQEIYRIVNVISHDMCQIADLSHELTLTSATEETNNKETNE